MGAVKAEALGGLMAAAAKQSEAVGAVREVLRDVKDALARLDPPRVEQTVALARRRLESLVVAASSAASLTRLAARAAGLADGVPLVELGERLGPTEGAELLAVARTLRRNLDELAVETAAQFVAARYGEGLCAHLVGLRASSAGYSAKGQLSPGTGTLRGRV